MPISVSPTTLRQILRPARAVSDDGEYRVAVSSDTVRLHALRTDHSAYLDYSLPVPSRHDPLVDAPRSFSVDLEKLTAILNIGFDDNIIIKFPFETCDSRIVFRSGPFTYRFPPVDSDSAANTWERSSVATRTTCTINHRHIDRAVHAANFAGYSLQVVVDPTRRYLEFRAPPDEPGDTFTYPVSDDQIDTIQGSSSRFTVLVHVLRQFTPHISVTSLVTIEVTSEYLVYRVEFPVDGASLTLYLAKRVAAL